MTLLPYRPNPAEWPLTPEGLQALNDTVENIYTELRRITTGTMLFDEGDEGDLVYFHSGSWQRLGVGTNKYFLQVVAGDPAWGVDGSLLEDLNATEITSGTLDPARLATSGVVAGTYGDASHVAQVTVDNKGRVTNAVDVAISIPPATHSLLSTTHPDTSPASPVLGDVITAQNSGAIDADKYWLDGQSFDYVPNANDNGAEAFWVDGLSGAGLISTGAVLWARKANGTPGYVLTATALGPEWAAASGGGVGASVYRATDQTIFDRVHTAINLSTVITDDVGFWSSGSPSRLTVPAGQAGWYSIVAQCGTLDSTGRNWYTEIFVNGTLRARAGGDSIVVQAAALVKLAVGDYVELYAYTEQNVPYGFTETLVGGQTSTFLQMVKF